jgi:hypothetical protein
VAGGPSVRRRSRVAGRAAHLRFGVRAGTNLQSSASAVTSFPHAAVALRLRFEGRWHARVPMQLRPQQRRLDPYQAATMQRAGLAAAAGTLAESGLAAGSPAGHMQVARRVAAALAQHMAAAAARAAVSSRNLYVQRRALL